MIQAPKLAALAVMLRAGRVLLVRRKNEPDAGLWGFPGGHVNLGETARAAAARELSEETGVIGQPVRYLTNVDIIVHDKAGALAFHFLLAAVLCDYISGDPRANDDVSEAEWKDIDTVLTNRLSCSQHVDTVLEMAMESAATDQKGEA